MATRYTLVITFGGDANEAPEDWERGAFASVASMINRGLTSGEIVVYDDDRAFRTFWDLQAEDE